MSAAIPGPTKDLLDAIFRAAPIALVLVARPGTIALANEEAERLFGYQAGEMVGQPIELLVPDRLRAKHVGDRSKFLSSPQTRHMGVSRALFALRKDGSEVPVEIALKSLETRGGNFVMAVVVDITERRYLERRFEMAIEAAPIAMLMLDADGRMTLVNRQAEKLYGYSRAELLGQPVEVLLPPEHRPRDLRQREEFFRATAPQRLGSPLRELSSLAIAMIDLDYFKQVNDRYGHAIGDAVLREAANLVRQECRAIDVIGRYGGEEFALALPGCDLWAGIAVCERIRRTFERFDWNRIAPGLKLTVSAGVSSSSADLDATALLRAADASLYAAKRIGRNRVLPELPAVAPT